MCFCSALTEPFVDARDAQASAEAARKAAGQVRGRPLYRTQFTSPSRELHPSFPYVDGGMRQRAANELDFFASVHAPGVARESEAAAAAVKQQQAWASRVVVSEPFVRHVPRDKSPADRLTSLLKGQPRKLGLRVVHEAVLPSGAHIEPSFAPRLGALNPPLSGLTAAMLGCGARCYDPACACAGGR